MIKICKVNNLKTLTYGRSYDVLYVYGGFYLIMNDLGATRRYSITNFYSFEEERSLIIDNILK